MAWASSAARRSHSLKGSDGNGIAWGAQGGCAGGFCPATTSAPAGKAASMPAPAPSNSSRLLTIGTSLQALPCPASRNIADSAVADAEAPRRLFLGGATPDVLQDGARLGLCDPVAASLGKR